MSALIARLKFGLWLIKKGYWSQLFQMALPSQHKNSRKEATQWCAEKAMSEEKALEMLGVNYEDISQTESSILEYAEDQHRKCPVKMGGPGSVNVLYNLVKAIRPETTLETGVAYGWSSMAILSGIKNSESAKLYSIDMPYPGANNEAYVGCVVHPKLRDKWTLIRKPDIDGLPLVLKKEKQLDFCHYDSDKSYRGRMKSSRKIWDSLKEGGIFMSDDINDNIAFKHFCEEVNRHPIIIEVDNKFAGIIKK